MAQQTTAQVENNFTKGFITESTGLNFPENAATDTDNCEYTLIGDVNRRLGIDLEVGYKTNVVGDRTNKALSTYKWNNVGGDGVTQLLVVQQGTTLNFYSVTASTIASPLSKNLLSSSVDVSAFVAIGGIFDATLECQFTDGNGYLFVYHPSCDPVYCTYSAGVVTGNRITVRVRDFTGVTEAGLASDARPSNLTPEHNYNLINQGWISGNPWQGVSFSSVVIGLGSKTFTVAAGLPITVGDQATITSNHATPIFPWQGSVMAGNVTAYSGTTLTINVTEGATGTFGYTQNDWLITPRNIAYISSWKTAIGNYPSNADVWWYFKNSTGLFDPGTTINNVSIGAGKAPRGHVILDAFYQQRGVATSLAITNVKTTVRPRTGCWFQGRVWYTGVDGQQPATGDVAYYTWTENIYFSTIVQSVDDLGHCYQTNDPTSEKLFDLLPTDGGVITIQGCGSIYKLFPLQNALIVFAANGVWYITGSQGIGFSANDYTIVKLSAVQSISSTSFVNVNGMPVFWNEDGIYKVEPAKQGKSLLSSPLHVNPLEVSPITVGTIASFYQKIPLSSKKYARGDYHPINYVIQWLYRSNEATSVGERYQFDKIMNYNTVNNAFFPYTASTATVSMNGINYVAGPGGSSSPPPTFKYLSLKLIGGISFGTTFSEEYRTDYADWSSAGTPSNYTSYFVTGYKLAGQAIKKFQPQYIQVYSRTNGAASAYKIQGIWNYANDRSSGKWSTNQIVTNALTRFDTIFRRHKIRGSGYALQFKISSVDGQPFDIQGWSVVDTVNVGT